MDMRLTVAALTLCSGCSFVFGGGPPADHQQMPYFDCPSTFGLPVADGFTAAGGLVGAITTFRQSKQEYADKNDKQNRNVAGGIDVALAAVFVASAVYGIVEANRCQAAKDQLKARILAPMLRPPVRPAPAPPPPPISVPAPTTPAPAPATTPAPPPG